MVGLTSALAISKIALYKLIMLRSLALACETSKRYYMYIKKPNDI